MQGERPSGVVRDRVEDGQVARVGDEILDRQGDAVLFHRLFHKLDVVVRDSGLQAGVEGDGGDQPAQDGHPPGGEGEGHGRVDQQDKAGRESGERAHKAACAAGTAFVPCGAGDGLPDRLRERFGRLPRFAQQGVPFVLSRHIASSSSSMRSSARARRCRVAAVPCGMPSAAAVSDRVRPVK